MSVFWPDKIEKPLEAILADVQQREPIIAAKIESAVDELTMLATEGRQVLARIDRIVAVAEAFAAKLAPKE
jgi:hypothetical protein